MLSIVNPHERIHILEDIIDDLLSMVVEKTRLIETLKEQLGESNETN